MKEDNTNEKYRKRHMTTFSICTDIIRYPSEAPNSTSTCITNIIYMNINKTSHYCVAERMKETNYQLPEYLNLGKRHREDHQTQLKTKINAVGEVHTQVPKPISKQLQHTRPNS